MLTWSKDIDLPVHLLLTKADKLKRGAATQTLGQVERTLAAAGLQPSLQLFSAHKRLGLEEARAALDSWFGISGTEKKDPGV
jgi:GTP-binding protein